ncbi:sulfatase-like hydrolase/transferase [bacterium]|nr:sulfatase-like hydrolase/transferase [bacterium]
MPPCLRCLIHCRRPIAAAAIAFLTVVGAIIFDQANAADTPPNILIITADNLGYGDLPCFRSDSPIKAPNFDRLARDGAMLTDFYTPSSTCTVSRACLLTGRIPQRHGLQIQLPGLEGNYGPGLRSSEILIPQMLKPAGYATGCFGKWNIGFAPGSRPTERGFDDFFGHASGNIDYYSHIYNGKHDLFDGIKETHTEGYSTDLFADAAIRFIRRNRERPWFCYLPFNAPHFPNARNKAPGQEAIWQAPDEAFAAYGYDPATRDPQQRYRAVVTALDAALGRMLDALDNLQQTHRTFVFFYSDNGAFMLKDRGLEVASNAPLRDGGVTCWEGGIRVAAIARWPGHIATGRVIREPLWSPDLMIACAKLANASLPPNHRLDGLDPLPVLTSETASPHRSLFFTYGRHAALRFGDWKIVRERPATPWQLFNLKNDLAETTDLAAQHPEQLARLVSEFNRWSASATQQTTTEPR